VDPAVAETGQPYAYAGDDPVNASDPSGDIACPSWVPGCGVVTDAQHAVSHAYSSVTTSSAYTWFNEHLNPAYLALTGYYNEWEATENGCGLGTELGYGAQRVLGVAGSLGIAFGGAEVAGGVGAAGAAGSAAPDLENLAPKIVAQMEQRGWTSEQIQEAFDNGEQVNAVNKATGGAATRYSTRVPDNRSSSTMRQVRSFMSAALVSAMDQAAGTSHE
jgi:hypothetical protein